MVSPGSETDNFVFAQAERFVTHTSRCIFLTGKAGTGKTTFLKHIRAVSRKKSVVVAPTGVAAINAGGVTIHSFFQLPFSPFVPFPALKGSSQTLFERHTFLQNLRIDNDKRLLLRELELLIIDEVSMVRCDVLDAIDVILRHFRRKEHIAFGGVQVLLIGDLYQLPPVVPESEWRILNEYYDSPFFFDAFATRASNPVYLELKKIYRQNDAEFINFLNKVRRNEVSPEDLDLLNKNHDPDFDPTEHEGYVTLTSHNYKADKINQYALGKLSGEARIFEAEIEGDFPERLYPTDKRLILKEGAQIMFIKNDMERIRRYYNGKIGFVARFIDDKIVVRFPGEEVELEVSKETWSNIRYSLNYNTRNVEEEVLGTFTQYSVRLAWAVTIHKSQGLTLHNVVIDAERSFAPGQVYVALSRCTTLKGIVLHSKIPRAAIQTDQRVVKYASEELSANDLEPVFAVAEQEHHLAAILNVFDWNIPLDETKAFHELLRLKKKVYHDDLADKVYKIESVLGEEAKVMERFVAQVMRISKEGTFNLIPERMAAAVEYFNKVVDDKLLPEIDLIREELSATKRIKKIKNALTDVTDVLVQSKRLLIRSRNLADTYFANKNEELPASVAPPDQG